MSAELIAKQIRVGALVVFAVLVLALATGALNAAQDCHNVQGQFSLQPVTGPACTSPVGICATGNYQGRLNGDSSFTGTGVIQTVDTPTTAVILVTGDNLIHTQDGDLMTKDAIALRTTGAGEFSEVDVIVGGTGAWAGATGTITATGTFTASAGGGGRYQGQICTA